MGKADKKQKKKKKIQPCPWKTEINTAIRKANWREQSKTIILGRVTIYTMLLKLI